MGPKKKEKKKEKKKKGEKEPKMTRSQYAAKIAEKNAILAKVRMDTKAVEDLYFDVETKYEKQREDMDDILEYLKYETQKNEEEIANYSSKNSKLRQQMESQDKYYENIFNSMESEHEEKMKSLQHQYEIIQSKLFAAAEIKSKRKDYLRRKEELLNKMEMMEAKQKEEIYEAEKEAIIKQDKMQKEMANQLASLASDFRQATSFAIGETTNNLLRKSIELGNKLTCMEEVVEEARDSYLKVHDLETKLKLNVELIDDEHQIVLKKYAHQVEFVEEILKSLEDLNERIAKCRTLADHRENRRLQRLIAEKECILKRKAMEVNDLLSILQGNEEHVNSINNAFEIGRTAIFKLHKNLYETAVKVKEALEVEGLTRIEGKEGEKEEEADKEEMEDNLKDYKLRFRETKIDEIIEKLTIGITSETDLLLGQSSETYLTSLSGSLASEAVLQRLVNCYVFYYES